MTTIFKPFVANELDLDAIDWDGFITSSNTENLVDAEDLTDDQPSMLQAEWQAPLASRIKPDDGSPVLVSEGIRRLTTRNARSGLTILLLNHWRQTRRKSSSLRS